MQETLNLSELEGYRIGGALHIVVNNQIGFTTDPSQGRSSPYATDIAKNAPESGLPRQWRRFRGRCDGRSPGHGLSQAVRARRGDRHVLLPASRPQRGRRTGVHSSPRLYRIIEARKSVRDGYLEHLLKLNGVSQEEADEIAARSRARLEEELSGARAEAPTAPPRPSMLGRVWSNYRGGPDQDAPEVDTGVDAERLRQLLGALTTLPEDFHPLTKSRRLLDLRKRMARGEHPLDWATAEALAFATLATEGTRIRLSGQDSERGTFSHRHAVLHDFENGRRHMPLQHLAPDQAPVEIYNSPLSEVGVLGFEHGYSIGYPDALVMWEAQFGDFHNAAQVIIDQFIVSAEDKWHSLSGLVLLLPHGFEGQGPEHSSARIERFLMMAAEDNIQVVVPTTPAQYFHALRRQVLRPWRKPLIVMTPKSLLRHARAVSRLEDLSHGRFQRVVPDDLERTQPPRRVLLCSGKLYYELQMERQDRGREDVAILRVEQLYPLAEETLAAALAPYPDGTSVRWVQEEPENMGAWRHIRLTYVDTVLRRFEFAGISRLASASPATGSANAHKLEQRQLLDEAFAGI